MDIFPQKTSFRNLGSAEKIFRPPKLGARSPPLESHVLTQTSTYNHTHRNTHRVKHMHSSSGIRSLDRHDLFVPRARTSMAQTRTFAIIGPSLWNQLIPSTQSTLLTGEPSASFRTLKIALFSLGLSHWKRF